ncbi:porin [Acidomonas methanolica]|uniref:Porin n=2 Tax=Acidomonas methanolica TaxID=437 RepID=A0A023D5T1_ACIMT|nr:porin [Acidomonas methanolica]MBU2652936.1 porin [Acidomonas methanolica]TCS31339.1 putative porin [Acidomonas methanolica]GAJ29518.1 hypothetical protein Amme_064_012 [Acidomonas methanolica NBRC 104435]GEK98413.1 hypothetical protein AME01nite_09120 [Acidomonas methanolica NBRC 104435]
MRLLRSRTSAFAITLLASSATGILAPVARADDYSDLLDILRAKGSLTKSEYSTLLSRHHHHVAVESPEEAPSRGRRHKLTRAAATSEDSAVARAQDAATRAEASAEAARQALLSTNNAMNNPLIVHTTPYVPGKGITFQAGPVAIKFSGFINGFYTFNSPAGGVPIAGGLSSGSSGFDSSAVRNGLLPAGFLVSLTTHQAGLDLSANLGVYPGDNSSQNGAFNANSGGKPVALGTSGIDFRQVYVTAGNSNIGTFTVGRNLGFFGGEAILNDATLLSVGSTGSNAAPGNTSLGRIGYGYVYADWLPQISYATPTWKGLQGKIGIFQPMDEFNYAGYGYSATSTQHSSPMIQGEALYDFATKGGLKGHLWSSFMIQHMQNIQGAGIVAGNNSHRGATVEAVDVGGKLSYSKFEALAYYYYGSGLGTTGLMFDGLAANGHKRDSEGYYFQGVYHITPKLRLVGSYGASNLYHATGDNMYIAGAPPLARRNSSEIGALFYQLTPWMQVLAEYAHSQSYGHGGPWAKESDNTMSVGTFLAF